MTIIDQPLQTTPVQYASFGERIAARLIDGMILILPSLFIPFILPWLYFALQEGSTNGATVGKRAMGIRVVSTEGKVIGFGTATGRFLGQFLNVFTLFIGYFLMLFNARSQCLHDMLTNTVVIKNTPAEAPRSVFQRQLQKRSWSSKLSATDIHFVELSEGGGRHWHRTESGEQVNDFTLWQLTDGMVDLTMAFTPESLEEMKQYAEQIMRSKA